MGKAEGREKMQTSGLGNDPKRPSGVNPQWSTWTEKNPPFSTNPERGFTLIELLVVMLIMALGAALASLSLTPSNKQHLNDEASRLIALLESAKAQARASSLNVTLGLSPNGFYFAGLSQNPLNPSFYPWLYPHTQAQLETGPVILGPEALTPPAVIVLSDTADPQQVIALASDGLRPFKVISH